MRDELNDLHRAAAWDAANKAPAWQEPERPTAAELYADEHGADDWDYE